MSTQSLSLLLESLSLLAVTGELRLARGGVLLLALLTAIPLCLGRGRYRLGRVSLAAATAAGVLLGNAPVQQVSYAALYLSPLLWVPGHARVNYILIAVFWQLTGKTTAAWLPEFGGNHLGNLHYLLLPWLYLSLRVAVASRPAVWMAPTASAISFVALHLLVVMGLHSAALPSDLWSLNSWRVFAVVLVSAPFARVSALPALKDSIRSDIVAVVFGVVTALVVLTVARSPVDTVIFDDSHGPWERTDSALTTSDWGRDTVYTYRLLFDRQATFGVTAQRVRSEEELLDAIKTSREALLILKTPMTAYSTVVINAVRTWVRQGGLVVLISDHTDLFGMTQRLNQLLPPAVPHFETTATYDNTGALTRPVTTLTEAGLGTPALLQEPRLFQTGTSIDASVLPHLQLMTYGLSYSQQANYAAVNRFGDFAPRVMYPYRDYAAMMFTPMNMSGGGWLLFADSTPWSSFSFCMPGYDLWWNGALTIAQFRRAWAFVSLLLYPPLLLIVLASTARRRAARLGAGWVIGVVLTTGILTHARATAVRDIANFEWQNGPTAVVEFLDALRPPNAQNFSQLFSLLPRFGRYPRVTGYGAPPRGTKEVLVLHPTDAGKYLAAWAEYVRSGGHLLVVDDASNGNLTGARRLLGALDIAVRESAVTTFRPATAESAASSWVRQVEWELSATRPTTVMSSRVGRWKRFRVGAGSVDVHLNGIELSNLGIGDVWVGKYPSNAATDAYREVAQLFGGEILPQQRYTQLPAIRVRDTLEYTLLVDGQEPVKGTASSACDTQSRGLTMSELICCDTLAWLDGLRAGPWRESDAYAWATEEPVRLANGQSYIGQVILKADGEVVVEWVHDGNWGDDRTHRILIRASAQ